MNGERISNDYTVYIHINLSASKNMFHFVLEKYEKIACFVTNNTKSKVTFEIDYIRLKIKPNSVRIRF